MAGALYLAALALGVALCRELAVLVIGFPGPSAARLGLFLAVEVFLVWAAARLIRSAGIAWQLALTSVAIGFLAAGLPALLGNWAGPAVTVRTVGACVLGVLAALLMRRLQRPGRRRQDA